MRVCFKHLLALALAASIAGCSSASSGVEEAEIRRTIDAADATFGACHFTDVAAHGKAATGDARLELVVAHVPSARAQLNVDLASAAADANECRDKGGVGAGPPIALRSPGCIGFSLGECRDALRGGIDMPVDDVTSGLMKLDVNGKPIDPMADVAWMGVIQGGLFRNATLVTASVGEGRRVNELKIALPADPFRARSEDEYDPTGFYTVVRPLLSADCAGKTKLDFYRFVENELKPSFAKASVIIDWKRGDNLDLGRTKSRPYCGRNIAIIRDIGRDPASVNIGDNAARYLVSSVDIQ